jgi:hypothetical protein
MRGGGSGAREGFMISKKQLIIGVIVLFVGYWLFTDPSGLADLTKDGANGGVDVTEDLFTAIIDFTKEI